MKISENSYIHTNIKKSVFNLLTFCKTVKRSTFCERKGKQSTVVWNQELHPFYILISAIQTNYFIDFFLASLLIIFKCQSEIICYVKEPTCITRCALHNCEKKTTPYTATHTQDLFIVCGVMQLIQHTNNIYVHFNQLGV